MTEDENDEEVANGLGDSDIEQNVYEGGFKSWEGATDLALLVLDRLSGEKGIRYKSQDHHVEVRLPRL